MSFVLVLMMGTLVDEESVLDHMVRSGSIFSCYVLLVIGLFYRLAIS